MIRESRQLKSYLRQQGLSLIEMMIALTLGSVLTVGLVQLFVANSQTYKLLNGQSRMQESARFAHEFIAHAVRAAGYKGCYSTNRGIITTLDPPDNLPYEFDLRSGIEGFNGQTSGSWLPSITSVLPKTVGGTDTNVFTWLDAGGTTKGAGNGIDTSAIIPKTDILTTRSMSTNEARLMANNYIITDPLIVKVPASGNELEVNKIAFVSDCEKGTLFTVTGVSLNDPLAGQATIAHALGVLPTSNTFWGLAEVNSFETDAILGPVESHTFYIAPGAGVNNLGNPVLSLWRKSGTEAPVELVEGVEDLQVLYGVDTNVDDVPNQYVVANLVTDFQDVVTVRVSVTVNSVDDVGSKMAPTHGCTVQPCISGETYDGLLRRTFTQTIYLRNHG